MESDVFNKYNYNHENINKIFNLLEKIQIKETLPEPKQQSELNKMQAEEIKEYRRSFYKKKEEKDQEPGVYITRVIQLKEAIMDLSRTDIKRLLSFSSHLYDDVLQHLFEKSEELGGKDFKRNDEHKEEYYQ